MEKISLRPGLERQGRVYVHNSPFYDDPVWQVFQEREKEFWQYKINQTSYNPDPKESFRSALWHWQIESSDFTGKRAVELGSGPFGFFSAIEKINPDHVPEELYIVDPLMDFYQQFELSGLIPAKGVLIKAPGEDVPLADGSVDVVVSTNTLDHVQDCRGFLKETRRLLNKNGKLFLSVHVLPWLLAPLKFLIKQVDKNHPHHLTEAYLVALLQEQGFVVRRKVSRAVIIEDRVPWEEGLAKALLCLVGFSIIRTVYTIAEVAGD